MSSISASINERIIRAQRIHETIVTLDSHIDVPLGFDGPDLRADSDGTGQFDLIKAARGGLHAAVLAVYASPAPATPDHIAKARAEAEQRYEIITGIAKRYPEKAGIAASPEALRALIKAGRFAIIIGFQNAFALGADLHALDEWLQRGVSVFAFTHFANNAWADSSRPFAALGDKPHALNGLSDLGKQAIKKLNASGVLLDVSQLTKKALLDALAVTRAPVIASHSAVRGLVDVERNLDDEELHLIAAGGGVVQIVAFSAYVKNYSPQLLAQLGDLFRTYELAAPQTMQEATGWLSNPITAQWSPEKFNTFISSLLQIMSAAPKAGVEDFVDAIDYAVKLIGIEHVGISSDFNHGGGVAGWEHVGESQNVTVELIKRGYSEADIAKLWGENFLRAWGQARAIASSAIARL